MPLAVQGWQAGQSMTALQGRQAHQAHQGCALRTIEWAMRQESPMAAIRAADFSQKRDGVVYYKQVRKSEKVGGLLRCCGAKLTATQEIGRASCRERVS